MPQTARHDCATIRRILLDSFGFPPRSLHLFSSDQMPPAWRPGSVLQNTDSPHYNQPAFGFILEYPDSPDTVPPTSSSTWPAQDENAHVTRYFDHDVPFCMVLGQQERNWEHRPPHHPARAANGPGSMLPLRKGHTLMNRNSSDVALL